MNNDSGFGAGGVPYEYTVSEKKGSTLIFKRVTLIALYVLWTVGITLAGVAAGAVVPFFAIAVLTVGVLVFFTWRLTQVEYEYSFFAGTLTVCRVLGGRSRRVLAEVKLRELAAVCSCDGENAPRIEAYSPDRVIYAASSSESPELCAAMWSDEETGKNLLYFEPNEKAVKIIRYYNISAVNLRKKS